MLQRWVVTLFCCSVIYITLFYQLGNLAFMGADEPRYARIGEEMNLRHSYVTPTLNFRPWLEKPPLLFWLEAGSFKLFGVHEWSARLPVALLGLLTLLVVGWFASYLAGGRAGVLAVLVLCTSSLFFVFARAASTDMPLAAAFTTAMVCAFQAWRSNRIIWSAGSGLALGLAVLAKGPVALVLFVGVFLFCCLLLQKIVWRWHQIACGALVFLVCTIPWFWLVWMENGYSFVSTFLINHHLARFVTDIHHHSQPLWYFPVVIVIGFFPWICFLGSAVLRAWRSGSHLLHEDHSDQLFLWLWVLVPLVFFSFSQSKLAGYVLPIFPPLAILVAIEWDHYLKGDTLTFRIMRSQLTVLSVMAFLVVGTLMWFFYSTYRTPVLGILLILPISAGMVRAWVEFRKKHSVEVFLSLVAAMTLFAALAFWKVAPVLDDYHSARDICRVAVPLISQREPLILYRYFHHSAHYYAAYQTTQESVVRLEDLHRYFLEQPQSDYYILTQEEGWEELQELNPELIRQNGNLYLVRLVSKTG